MRTEIFAVAVSLLAIAAAPPPDAVQLHAADIVWKDAAAPLPAGSKAAVLEGNPKAAGPFTMRVRVPAGAKIAPHWHPRPERVTILSGELRLGFGDAFDEGSTSTFRAGDFYINPPQSHHFIYFDRDTELQITGEGPWELN